MNGIYIKKNNIIDNNVERYNMVRLISYYYR